MKKLLILLMVVASVLLALPNSISAESIYDEKIDIEIIKDNNTITINHTSGKNIEYAVVEYSFMKDGRYISMLDTFDVRNDKFTINKGVSTIAVKVWQLKELKNNIYYRYSTSNKNSVGSFTGVERIAIVEIETRHIEVVKLDIVSSRKQLSPRHKYYEFYFDFEKEHDEVISIDVEYIVTEYIFLGLFKGDSYNVSDNINIYNDLVISGYEQYAAGGSVGHRPATRSVIALEPNDSKHEGTHVARASAPTSYLKDAFKIENFAIITIEYTVDGEFYIDQVINDPTTPIEDDINEIKRLLEYLKSILGNITGLVSKVTDFFNGNASTVVKVIIFIVASILLGPVLFILKTIFTAVKYILKIPGMIINTFKILFVPKKNERKWK